jgi:hypothetical protein
MPILQGTLAVSPQPQDQTATTLVEAMPPRIEVHDASFNMVGKGFGSLEEKFDPGLYLVRVEAGGRPFEKVIHVQPESTANVSYPVFSQPLSSSAGVVAGSSSLHEYTGDYTRQLSQTKAKVRLGSGARLVVLASRPSPAERAPIKFQSIRLLDKEGVCVADLARRAPAQGSLDDQLSIGFAAEVSPGALVIEWKDENQGAAFCWRQPLWLPEGYVMLLFLTVPAGATAPTIDSASIHLAPLDSGFEPRFPSASAAESALESLRTGRQLLSRERLEKDLLEQKFNNPMLGIYGAHMVLRRSIPDSEKAEILKEVLGNLEKLAPGHPDVSALRLMGRGFLAQSLVPPCSWPPMIRLGYSAFRDADWEQSGAFIERNSVGDRIRSAFAFGGVWTKWSAERGSVAEFPTADPTHLTKTIFNRLAPAAKSLGLDVPSETVQELSSAISGTGLLLGKQVLTALAPALLSKSPEGVGPDEQRLIARTFSTLTREPVSTSESDVSLQQNALENLQWTGLNKDQIREVARSVFK